MNIVVDIWRLLDRRQRRQLFVLQFVSVLIAFSTLGGIAAVIPFLSVLADPASIHSRPFLSSLYERFGLSSDPAFMVALGIGFVVAVIVANGIALLGTIAMNRYAYSVGSTLGTRLFIAYLHRDYGYFAVNSSTDLLSNVLFQASRLTAAFLQNILLLVTNVVTIVFIVATLIALNPIVALVACIALGLSYALIYLAVRRKLLLNGQTESKLLVERTRVVQESFGAIKEIIVTRSHAFFAKQFAQSTDTIADTVVNTQSIILTPKHILESLAVAGLVGAALWLRSAGAGGIHWLAQLTFIGFAAYRLLPALQQVFSAVVKVRTDRAFLERIARDLHAAVPDNVSARPSDVSWRKRPLRELRLRDVEFRYAPDLPPVVRDATLQIPSGSIVAIVGNSGAGKTVLAEIILGLLVPQSGRLEIDDIPIDESNRSAWLSSVAYVPQNIFLLDTSVAENIALGRAEHELDRQCMHEAATLAGVDEFVSKLPQGFATRLGERGVRLSGGQRQRIGIARALYRDASMLVLDEATSALHGLAEQELIATLKQLRGRKTILVVAHSENVVRHADRVFEVVDGRPRVRGATRRITESKTAAEETSIHP